MVYWNLRQVHLQEVGMMQIPGDYDFFNIFSSVTDFTTNGKAYSKTNSRVDKHHQIIILNW